MAVVSTESAAIALSFTGASLPDPLSVLPSVRFPDPNITPAWTGAAAMGETGSVLAVGLSAVQAETMRAAIGARRRRVFMALRGPFPAFAGISQDRRQEGAFHDNAYHTLTASLRGEISFHFPGDEDGSGFGPVMPGSLDFTSPFRRRAADWPCLAS